MNDIVKYIIKVLEHLLNTTTVEKSKPMVQSALDFLKNLPDLIRANEFLEASNSVNFPISIDELDEEQKYLSKFQEEIRQINSQYYDAIRSKVFDVHALERLKPELNRIRQELSEYVNNTSRAYKRAKRFLEKNYLEKEAAKRSERDGVSLDTARKAIKQYEVYRDFEERVEDVMGVRDSFEDLYKDLDVLHTDIRQSITTIRGTLPVK